MILSIGTGWALVFGCYQLRGGNRRAVVGRAARSGRTGAVTGCAEATVAAGLGGEGQVVCGIAGAVADDA
jgi:hypothetical protein